MKITIYLSVLILFVCNMAAQEGKQNDRQRRRHNPADPSVHDPVMIKQDDIYYLFSTGNGIKVMTSKDMMNWEMEKPVFDMPPQWAVDLVPGFKGHIWAPDIIYYQGKYHLFYSCSAFGKNTSAIGHATNPTLDRNDPKFKWTDHGKIIQSVPNRDLWNAIDPNIIVDENGTPWMNFGSFWDGLKLVKLTDDMMSVAQPEEWYSISRYPRTYANENNPTEAPFIMRHGNYYYLFVSFDYCCRGVESTYKVVVGRSKNVTGPYLDKDGVDMAKGGGTLVIEGDGKQWAGVGHNAAYNFDGQDYFVGHGYSIPDNGKSKLITRKIEWDEDDFPVVKVY